MARRKKSRSQANSPRRPESLEARQVMSANPLLGGPALTTHLVEEAPALAQHAVVEANPEYDFRIDQQTLLGDQNALDGRIEQTLNQAHALTGLDVASARYGFDGSGQTVAVIDSGIAYRHFALGGGLGADYRVVGGYDFTENDADPYDDGPAGSHGTHVAGIVGASGGAHEGVAPGVDLVGLRVFDDAGNGFFSWVEQALQWVHDNQNAFENPITAVNLSLGTEFNGSGIPGWAMLENEFAQLEADGIFISVSAGNSYQNFLENGLSYPAASPHVIPVLATDNDGSLAFFSQRHARGIAAPGRFITSTVPDYAGNDANSIDDDYLSFSGTSQAAPYVAGASVLIREAFEFVGQTGLNQWEIYDHIVSTADVFFDSASQTSYNRLNIEAAIDAILPDDDFGSTVATAHNLGVVNDGSGLGTQSTVSGVVTTLDDTDFFSFTAGATGTVTVEATNVTHSLDVQWGGGWTLNADGSYSLEVVAGQQYAFGLSSADGLGYYDLSLNLEAAETFTPTEWGTIGPQETRAWQPTGADQWFRVTAGRTGYFTAEALNAQGGNATIAVYDAQQNLISTPGARADALATAGQELLIRVTGDAASYDVRMTNALDVSGGMATLIGTAGDDEVSFTAGSTNHTATLNGVTYSFAVSNVQIDSGGGADSARIYGSSADEIFDLRARHTAFTGDSLTLEANGFNLVDAFSGGGNDIAQLYDTAGDDRVRAYADRVVLEGTGIFNRVLGFSRVDVFATTGNDIASLYDTSGSERVRSYADRTVIEGIGFFNRVLGFDRTDAYSSGGADLVSLYDTEGNDLLRAYNDRVVLQGVGFLNRAIGFERVDAFSSNVGDRAELYGTAGDEQYRAYGDRAILQGDGFFNRAIGFSRVDAYSNGGNDLASFYGSATVDRAYVYSDRTILQGSGFLNRSLGFQRNDLYASGAGDIVQLYDTAGNDLLRAYSDRIVLEGAGYLNRSFGFDRSLAYSSGGNDTAILFGTAGNETLVSREGRTRIQGEGFRTDAVGFSRIETRGAGGFDVAVLIGNDDDNAATASSSQATINWNQVSSTVSDFDYVELRSGTGDNTIDESAVDFALALTGIWR